MKKVFLISMFAAVYATAAWSQDIITTRNGETIEAVVKERTDSEVRYKKFNYQQGPTFVLSANQVESVRYSNGTIVTYSQAPVEVEADTARVHSRYDNISGFRSEFGYSRMKWGSGADYANDKFNGFYFGFSYAFRLNSAESANGIYLSPGAHFVHELWAMTDGAGIKGRHKHNLLHVPVYVKWSPVVFKGNSYFMAGPDFNILLSSMMTYKGSIAFGSGSGSVNSEQDWSDKYNKFNLGLTFGYAISLWSKIDFEYSMSFGLVNVRPNDSFKQRFTRLGVNYHF